MADEKGEGGIWGKLVIGVVSALVVGGATPWWWGKLFERESSPLTSSEVGNASTPAQRVKNEVLTVYADSVKGTSWINKWDGYVKVDFEATGKWLSIPDNDPGINSNPEIPEHAKGYLSATGDPDFQSNEAVCKQVPLGALVVVGEDNRCKAYGAQGSLELRPGEAIVFKMNDVEGLYQDNKGQIDVKLVISRE